MADDFDIDNMDLDNFGDDSFGNAGGFDTEGGGGRSPITNFAFSTLRTAGSSAKNLDVHLNILRRALPNNYRGALDLIEAGNSRTSSVYDKALDKLRPVTNDVRQIARGVQSSINKVIPRKLADKLDGWINSGDDESYSSGGNRDQDEMDSGLQEVFAIQTQEMLRKNADDRKHRIVKDKIERDRHADQKQILSNIRLGISRLVGYQDSITFKYQRKSLELQYRQFYAARDTITAIQKGNDGILQALSSITKNTSLPDAVKMKSTELFGLKTKENLIKKIHDRSFGGIGGIMDRMADNLGNMITNAMDVAGMMTSGIVSATSMGSMSSMGGDMAGGGAANAIGGGIGDAINARYRSNKKLNALGASLNKITTSLGGYVAHKASKSGGLWNSLNDLIAGPSLNTGTTISEDRDDKLEAVSFTKKTQTTVNDVIPGYLARILQRLSSKDGHESPMIMYNHDSGKWVTKKGLKKEITTRLHREGGDKSTLQRSMAALDLIDPNRELPESARIAIQKKMLADAASGKSFYAKSYSSRENYAEGTSAADVRKIAWHMKKYLNTNEGMSADERILRDEKHAEIGDISNDLARYIKPLMVELSMQRELGNEAALISMKFIKEDRYGKAWNTDKILDFLIENHDIDPAPLTAAQTREQANRATAERLRTRLGDAVNRTSRSINRNINRLRNTEVGQTVERESRRNIDRARNILNNQVTNRITESPVYTQSRTRISSLMQTITDMVMELESVNGEVITSGTLGRDAAKLKQGAKKKAKKAANAAKKQAKQGVDFVAEQVNRGGNYVRDLHARTTGGDADASIGGEPVIQRAEGGVVKGPGTETSDSIKARLSNGEYVIKASAVKRLGVPYLDRLNESGNKNLGKAESLTKGIKLLLQGDPKQIKSLRDKINTLKKSAMATIEGNQSASYLFNMVNILKTDLESVAAERGMGAAERKVIYDDLAKRAKDISDDITTSERYAEMRKKGAGYLEEIKGFKNSERADSILKKLTGAKDIVVKVVSDGYTDATRRIKDGTRRVDGGPPVDGGGSSELAELTRQILSVSNEIRDAQIMSVKLLESGLKVSGIEISRGGLTKGLRSGIGKLISGAGSIIGGTMKLYGTGIGLAGSALGYTGKAVGSIVDRSLRGLIYQDIFLKGTKGPVITARELKAGIIINEPNGKVVKKLAHITGATYKMVDDEKEYITTMDDVEKLYIVKGKPIFNRLLHGAMSVTKVLFSPMVAASRLATWAIRGLTNALMVPKDIYISGETTPRLLGRILSQGGYFSSVTGKPVHSIKDFNGDVVDQHGEVLLAVSEMSKMVDRRGNPYRTLGEKVLHAGKAVIKAGFKAVAWVAIKSYKIMAGGMKLVGKALGLGKGMLGGALKGGARSLGYGPLVKRNPDLIVHVHTNEILLMIAELLNSRLGRKVSGDADGDGDKDNGWQDRIKAMRDRYKEKKPKGGKVEAAVGANKPAGDAEKKEGGIADILTGGGKAGFLKRLFTGTAARAALVAGGGLAAGYGASRMGAGGGTSTALGLGGAAAAGMVATGNGGLLLSGASAAAGYGATGLAALAGVLTAPVALSALGVAAVGLGGYYLYKKLSKGTPDFLTIRMSQYGVDISEKDRVEKILKLEEFLLPNVKIKDKDGYFQISQSDSIDIANIFGVKVDDATGLGKMQSWLANVFKPVFLKHCAKAMELTESNDPNDLDNKLKGSQKLDALRDIRSPITSSINLNYSPFSGPLTVDGPKAEAIFNKTASDVEKRGTAGAAGDQKKSGWFDWFKKGDKGNASATGAGGLPKEEKSTLAKITDSVKSSYTSVADKVSGMLGTKRDTAIKTAVNTVPAGTPVASSTPTNTGSSKSGPVPYRMTPLKSIVTPAKSSPTDASVGPTIMPTNGRITSKFGPRIHPVTGRAKEHTGIDIGAAFGSPIRAWAAGHVINKSSKGGYGNCLWLRHADGTSTRYAHMSSFNNALSIGSYVESGTVIGYVGSTGMSTGNHLHFEIRSAANVPIDPLKVMKDKESMMAIKTANEEIKAATDPHGEDGPPPDEGANTLVSTATKKPTEGPKAEAANAKQVRASANVISKANTSPIMANAVRSQPARPTSVKAMASEVVEKQRSESKPKLSERSYDKPVDNSVQVRQLAVLQESLGYHKGMYEMLSDISKKLTPTEQPNVSPSTERVRGNRPYQVDNSPNPVSMKRG